MISNNKSLDILFIGCVDFSQAALDLLINSASEKINVVGIVSKSQSPMNADHCNLLPCGIQHKIPTLDFYNESERLHDFICSTGADVIYCFGWSHIIPEQLLTLVPKGIIGFHPTKLPENRGRHPIIWALALGLNETGSTFFKMDKGVDSGDIISQGIVSIEDEDNAKSLYRKITKMALQQIAEFSLQLRDNTEVFIPQKEVDASQWRKRTAKDGLIDWRMEAKTIYNLVRALDEPYIGAEFTYKNHVYKVWKARVSKKSVNESIIPGSIINVYEHDLLIKCAGTSAIWVEGIMQKNDLKLGDCL